MSKNDKSNIVDRLISNYLSAQFFIITLLLFTTTLHVFGQQKPLRLFLIGNSFSQNASKFLPEISESGGHQLVIGRAELPGCELKRHWESVVTNDQDASNPKGKPYGGKSLRELLESGNWDVVTIQQYSLLSGDSNTYQPYAQNLYKLIKQLQPHAEVVIHQTWAYRADAKNFGKIAGEERAKDQNEMWMKSRAAYHHLAQTLKLRIVPVGDAIQRVNTNPKWGFKIDTTFNYESAEYPNLPNQTHSLNVGYHYDKNKKLTFDPNHANDAGCYLAGLVWYQFLFDGDPNKIKFLPQGIDKEFAKVLKTAAKN
ncbi:MAG: DUF4886 domain-containing protein [Pedobacter agri]|uniref:DUF4886 domain-containing protein n=1 Tax=Pedobacter agri TaxID=454586 RepID=UPI002780A07D|nr:DUF4886 domain-containing protein [Pedobacter agri]MDQ1142890.1 hypothetical protein [Pedobacter agri]